MEAPQVVFLIEKSMGLFWVLVQQICFCGARYLYEGLLSDRSLRRFYAGQFVIALLFVCLCFERELGLPFFSSWLVVGTRDFYPWAVRITLCGVMIAFDMLLLLHVYRVFRIYKRGRVRFASWADGAIVAGTGLLCVVYIWRSIRATLAFNLSIDDYTWIGRAFIQFSNFFYMPLEIGAAFIFYAFLKTLRREKHRDEKHPNEGLSMRKDLHG
ncbi:MAG: hypothetical protein LBR61_12805 [Synergistaceae bacterium]|jgi:hypothetical protein|nr:hypothetical protein [Synergistaceae bacterium]